MAHEFRGVLRLHCRRFRMQVACQVALSTCYAAQLGEHSSRALRCGGPSPHGFILS